MQMMMLYEITLPIKGVCHQKTEFGDGNLFFTSNFFAVKYRLVIIDSNFQATQGIKLPSHLQH